MLALPVRLGGMGILNPMTCSSQCFNSSKQLTSPLVALIISQEDKLPSDGATLSETRKSIHSENRKLQNALDDCIYDNLSAKQQRPVDLSRKKGASSWLSVLPLDELGFSLHEGEFRDAVCLRYGWSLPNVSSSCSCGMSFSVDHAMTCNLGSFPTIRHNEIQDLTVSLLSEVCHNVAIEPHLQPLNDKGFHHKSANMNLIYMPGVFARMLTLI